MAGIGFQLHRLVEDSSFFNKAKAYIFASIITSGPWILSILCLTILGILSSLFLTDEGFLVIRVTIIYSFAGSIIFTAPIQFVLTRYLADKEYLKQKEKMLSALISALVLSAVLGLGIALFWYAHVDGTLEYKIAAVSLFVIISMIWTMIDFLSCLKQYVRIVLAFLIGNALSIGFLIGGSAFFGNTGALAGYALGQFSIFLFLFISIKKEYALNGFFNVEFFTYFYKFPAILLTGLFYNLGLWGDKIIGWIFLGDSVFSIFKAFSLYDTPVFIAYLSIIPALAYFFIQSETRFFLAYRKFFDSIADETLQNIVLYKNDLVSLLKKSLFRLFLIQAVVIIICELASPYIGIFIGLSAEAIPVLRILFIAAGFQVLFLFVIIFLMYFDLSLTSMLLSGMFFVLNVFFSLYTVFNPLFLYGSGYLAAIAAVLIFGTFVLLYSVRGLEYKIFMNQEI